MIYNIFSFLLVTYIEYNIGKNVFIESRKYDDSKNRYITISEPFLNRGFFILVTLSNLVPVIREVILFGMVSYILITHNNGIVVTGKANNVIIKIKKFLSSELW